jgi:hypothetical protein
MWLLVAILNGLPIGLEEYANFRRCMEGPGDVAMRYAYPCSDCTIGQGYILCWAVWDTDRDGDIDLRDYAVFQGGFNGTTRMASDD